MNGALLKAKEILKSGDFAVVITDGETVFSSHERGVAALLKFASEGRRFDGFSAADKVIGKGAAFMYIFLGVKEVYTPVMSAHALELLECRGVAAHYDSLVPMILNREGNGPCHMEVAVMNAKDKNEAFKNMKAALT